MTTMLSYLHTLSLSVTLTDRGDALIWGEKDGRDIGGEQLARLLFAWHAPSYYGTTLEITAAGEFSLVVLPAEMALPYFAAPNFLEIAEWHMATEAGRQLLELAPLLLLAAEEGSYLPSFEAYRRGELAWTWDGRAEMFEGVDWAAISRLEGFGDSLSGLRALFSAAVKQRHYASDAALGDLRRDYPALFRTAPGLSAEAITEGEWLAAMGWRPDIAPFRPALQLLEPDDEDPAWRLRLVLTDRQDGSFMIPVRLQEDGQATGDWDDAWEPFVAERAPGWAARLGAALPGLTSRGVLLGTTLTDESAWSFLTTNSRQLLEDGWNVLLPGWWEAASKRKPRLSARLAEGAGSGGGGESLFGMNALVSFDWRVAIGENSLSEAEFMSLLERNERLVRFRGEWIYLDPALLEQIRRLMASVDPAEGLSLQDILQLHLLSELEKEQAAERRASGRKEESEEEAEDDDRVELEVELNAHLLKLMRQLAQPSDIPAWPVPAGLQAELRGYQRQGFTWLSYMRQYGLGACLADDMGLGKTVQFITYLLHHQPVSEQPALLVCPTSVLGNWQKELARFAPELRVMLHYGKSRLSGDELTEALPHTDIVLTSYTTALLDQETLQAYTWSSLCLDEAQNIKNAANKQSAAIRSLSALHRIALTGTPIENRLSELWSIYDFMNPGFLGSQRGFQQRFATPIEKHQDTERTAQLQQFIKPFMLRRKKKDPAIQLDLPDKLENKVYINLTAEQGAMYEQTVKELMSRMQQLEGMERKGAILGALTQLKQLCDHPVLLSKELDIMESTQLSEEIREMLIGRSAKLERLVTMVDELRDEGDSCLIFTQYVGMGRMLANLLSAQRGEPVLYLNGSTPKQARDGMIESFQAFDGVGPGPGIFVLSLKAGGVGLNLTAANHVFHFDRWWNPAVENQATDRAYRMGQKKNVQVHKFISLGTLEERIDEMLENKMSLSENVISSSEGWITELSNEELQDLFTLRRTW